jgi:hypothetical protein
MGKNIFDITKEYEDILSIIEDNEGEITPEIAEKLSINESELEDKLRNYKHIIDRYKYEKEYVKDEQERLRNKIASRENTIRFLKNNIVETLKIYGIKSNTNYKLKYPDFTVYTRDSKSIDYDDSKLEFVIDKLENEDYSYNQTDIINNLINVEFTVEVLIVDYKYFINKCNDNKYEVKDIKRSLNKTYAKELIKSREECEDIIINKREEDDVEAVYENLSEYEEVIADLNITENTSTTAIFK